MRLQFLNAMPYILQSTSMCCRIQVINMLDVKVEKRGHLSSSNLLTYVQLSCTGMQAPLQQLRCR